MEELNNNEEIINDNIEETDNSAVDTTVEGTSEIRAKNHKRAWKIILGVILGAFLCSAVAFAVVVFTSPKFRYCKLVERGFDSVNNVIQDFQDSVFGRIVNLNTNNKMSINTEVSTNIETENSDLLEWLGGLKTVKLVANENSNAKGNYFDSDINIGVNDDAIFLVNLLRKDNAFSAKAENITDGYISVDNNNLSSLWEKIGYKGPDKFTSQLETVESFKLSKNEQRNLKNALVRLGKAFMTVFDDDDFSEGKGTITYGDKTLEANYIDFKMNSFEMNNGIIAAMEQLLKEDKAIDVLVKLSNTYDEMYNQMGYQITPLTRDEFVNALTNILEQVRILQFSEDDGVIIRLYRKGSSIAKTEVFNINYSNSILKFVTIDDGNDKYYEYSNDLQSYTDNVSMAEKGIWTHEVSINFINSETGGFLEGYGDKIIITADNSSKNYSKIIASAESGVSDYTLIGKIKDNEKNITLNVLVSDEYSTNEINIKCSIKENSDFEEKTLNTDETFDTTKATDEEITAKRDQVLKNWLIFYAKNNEKMKQLYTAISIYLGSVMPQNTSSSSNNAWEGMLAQ